MDLHVKIKYHFFSIFISYSSCKRSVGRSGVPTYLTKVEYVLQKLHVVDLITQKCAN